VWQITQAILVFTLLAYLIWRGAQSMNYRWQWYRVEPFFFRYVGDQFIWGPFMKGVVQTLNLAGISCVLAIAIGLLTALARLSNSIFGRIIAKWYLESVRNTPLLVQLFLFYFVLIITGMSITPQRNLTVNFTIPYAHSGLQIASIIALTQGFDTLERYNAADVTLACHRGAVPCDYAQANFPLATIRKFDDDAQVFQEVVNGNAHAMFAAAPKPRFWADSHPDTIHLPFDGKRLTRGDEAFALRKGDLDSLNFFSNWILINTSNGWLGEAHARWFDDQSAWRGKVAKN